MIFMNTTYKSLLERYVTELYTVGAIKELSAEANMQILDELSKGMDTFIEDQNVKNWLTEQELPSILLS